MPRARAPHRAGSFNPEDGPRILFFSGGSALNGVARVLKRSTHNSIHLVTPFDSGGSSAELRRAFNMPAIGDLRARLLALADETVPGYTEACRLLNYRLPHNTSRQALRKELRQLTDGKAALMQDLPAAMRDVICMQLGRFWQSMPDDFDLRGANIGNLVLTGGYLAHDQDMAPILRLFSELIGAQGTVRWMVNDTLHLGATLEDGHEVIGQHHLTGKEVTPINSPVDELFLSHSANRRMDAHPQLGPDNRALIESADLICYPPGSFYSSLMANLLPIGVGDAVASNPHPKVFIPNQGADPEQLGRCFPELIEQLLGSLQANSKAAFTTNRLLNFVLVDRKNGLYPQGLSRSALEKLNLEMIDMPLISKSSAPYYDNDKLVAALLSLAE